MYRITSLFISPVWLCSLLLFFSSISHAQKNAHNELELLQQHPETFQFSTKQNQELALKLAKDLRCPQCQNQNLIESNSPIAQDLRLKVYKKVELGQNKQQIIDYMTQRFGEMVHYQPPLNNTTVMLWAGPLAIFLLFLWLILRKVSRPRLIKKE